jgi:hypothetical protein
MNMFAGVGLLGVTGVLLYVFVEQKPADVYDMPMKDVYAQLIKTDLGEATAEPWMGLTTSRTGNGRDSLTWKRSTSHFGQTCNIKLTPVEGDAERTHVAIKCNTGSAPAGAAIGMVHNMARNQNIERIDAALTGREYDKDRAGSTSSRWPGDGVDGSYATAVKKAHEMDAEMRKMQQQGF